MAVDHCAHANDIDGYFVEFLQDRKGGAQSPPPKDWPSITVSLDQGVGHGWNARLGVEMMCTVVYHCRSFLHSSHCLHEMHKNFPVDKDQMSTLT